MREETTFELRISEATRQRISVPSLRFLDANNEGDYVSKFQVFMTPDWDHEILEQLGPTYSLDKCRFKNKEIEPHTLPKDWRNAQY